MITWQYIAGFFDGEGCIGTRNGLQAKLILTQTNELVLLEIQKFLQTHDVTSYVYHKTTANNLLGKKPVYTLEINSKESVSAFLKNTLPYLYVKRSRAIDALRYFLLFPDMKFLRNRHKRISLFGKDKIWQIQPMQLT